MKNKNIKISKGYRLRRSTHNLIKNIQKLIQCTQEEAIGFACRKYYKGLMSEGKRSNSQQRKRIFK